MFNITFGFDGKTDSQYITFKRNSSEWARLWFDSKGIGFDFSSNAGINWSRIWEK